MAINNFEVFQDQLYTGVQEFIADNYNILNDRSGGTIVSMLSPNQGDYNQSTEFKHIDGIVERRDVYGSGVVGTENLEHIEKVSIKLARRTKALELPRHELQWINSSENGAVDAADKWINLIGEQMVTDKIKSAITVAVAAMGANANIYLDATAGTMTPTVLANGQGKLGDRRGDVKAWIMTGKVYNNLLVHGLANAERLFTWGTVSIATDSQGTPIIITDNDDLVDGTDYYTLGLVDNAIMLEDNGDYFQNFHTPNKTENIITTLQAEWSYNLSLKGLAWDIANGGANPNAAALTTATNWDQYVTSYKDLPGVIIETL